MEKANYFKGFLPEFTRDNKPKLIASELFQLLMLRRPD